VDVDVVELKKVVVLVVEDVDVDVAVVAELVDVIELVVL